MTQDDIEQMAERLAKANRRYFYVYVACNILIVTIWFCITSYNLYTYKKESDELLERIRQIHTVEYKDAQYESDNGRHEQQGTSSGSTSGG
ncbi:hypothetical protein AbSZ3_40 [Acinetobacter phage Ab_SZ3]|uniref:Uncharacterized protein n=1 Tax=Acinetobacter phage Ab_SZ3 TaxID=2781361 RepID=A0A873WW39_9CAUD|nr:hypothetical protein AbSZ3_40 [Acinetobacter phage Ab_SZ3]